MKSRPDNRIGRINRIQKDLKKRKEGLDLVFFHPLLLSHPVNHSSSSGYPVKFFSYLILELDSSMEVFA